MVVLGRGRGADIELADASISRRHALIYNRDEVPLIVDMCSANGTWVGEQRLTPEKGVAVALGEVFRLGTVTPVLLPHLIGWA